MAGIDLKTLAGRAAIALALGVAPLALGACGGGEEDGTDAATDGGAAGNRDGGRDTGSEDDEDGAVSGRDAGANRDAGGGGGQDAGDDAAVDSLPPSITEGKFQQVGRDGNDVRIDVTGRAGDSPVSAMNLRIVNTAGEDVALKDLDDDGDLDPGQIEVALSAPLTSTKADASAFVTLTGVLLRDALIDHAVITLFDAEKQTSDELELSFEDQTVLGENDACDRTYVANRCGDDLGCKGASPKCLPGEAPKIEKVGYFVDSLGARMLIAATDADDDIASYKIYYLDASGNPVVAVDTNADQSPDASELEFEAEYPGEGGKFFARIDLPSQDLVNLVARIRVDVTDRGGRSVTSPVVAKAEAPARANNVACDTRTFDRCNTGSVCVPGATAPAGKCLTLTNARMTACNAALELDPAKGKNSVQSVIGYPSLWDVPANSGCSSSDPEGRPERLVKLTLTEHADVVTLSTNYPLTNFDTTLYAMRSCSGSVPELWCVDDLDYGTPNYTRAVLELTDLDPGEYFIVVDSFSSMGQGAAFELGVTLQ